MWVVCIYHSFHHLPIAYVLHVEFDLSHVTHEPTVTSWSAMNGQHTIGFLATTLSSVEFHQLCMRNAATSPCCWTSSCRPSPWCTLLCCHFPQLPCDGAAAFFGKWSLAAQPTRSASRCSWGHTRTSWSRVCWESPCSRGRLPRDCFLLNSCREHLRLTYRKSQSEMRFSKIFNLISIVDFQRFFFQKFQILS